MKKVLLMLIFSPFFSFSDDWGWELTEENIVNEEAKEDSISGKLINYYQENISNIQGDRCPMHPSCSNFTKSAIDVFGFKTGVLMGLERIYFRENKGLFLEDPLYETIRINNHRRFYDNIWANNIFITNYWFFYNPDFYINPAKGK